MCLGAPWMSGLTALICGEDNSLFALVEEGDEGEAAASIKYHRESCSCLPKIKNAADPSFLIDA